MAPIGRSLTRTLSLVVPAAALVALAAAGCGRKPVTQAAEEPFALPVDVYADTGRTTPMRIQPPPSPEPVRAAVWLATV
ncbi:MAG TPA: hypothetical protein VJY35_00550, partial [Candidatus Eisenbacteria bacterium]|nr:hypothetical protein [Candidatus Eisenbacteria bacterium]